MIYLKSAVILVAISTMMIGLITSIVLVTISNSSGKDVPAEDPNSTIKWVECLSRSERYTLSPTPVAPSEARDYCYNVVSENSTVVMIKDDVVDTCMFNTLRQLSTVMPARGLLGAKSIEGHDYQWMDGSLVNDTYTNWKEWHISPPQDECMMALAQSSSFGSYGWYSMDCSIGTQVLCRDCASGYYLLRSFCYKYCTDVGDYDYWVVTCENDIDPDERAEYLSRYGIVEEVEELEEVEEAGDQYDFYDVNVGVDPTTTSTVAPTTTTVAPPTTETPKTWLCKFQTLNNGCLTYNIDLNMTRNGTIDFSSNEITQINDHSFDGADDLELKYIDLSNNLIESLAPLVFAKYIKLLRIKLGRNDFKRLPQNIFKTLTSLEYLSLNDNHVESLPRETFDTTKLKGLYMSRNNFTSLGSEIFYSLTQVETITLDGNELISLPMMDTLFTASSMASLTRFELQNNIIYVLKDKQFDGLKNIEYLDLSGNDLTEIGSMAFYFTSRPNIKRLLLGNNQISSFANSALQYTVANYWELLDLHNNRLSSLNYQMFLRMDYLIGLDVSENRLQTLPVNVFTYPCKLKMLDLAKNQITTLPYGVFDKLTNLKYLDLAGNNLYYVNSDLFTELNNIIYLNLDDNSCSFAPEQCGGEPSASFILVTCHCS